MADLLPLNLFQRLLRQWERVHPYNAAQIMRVAGHVDPQRAGEAFNQAVRALGLGRLIVQGTRYRFEPAEIPITTLATGTTDDDLAAHLSGGLDTAFDDAAAPFRPFVVPGDTTRLGVVYQHWVADSVTMRLLMREWFVRMFDPAAIQSKPPTSVRLGYWRLFSPLHAHWSLIGGLIAAFRRYFAYRRCRKVASVDHNQPASSIVAMRTDATLMASIVAYAKSHNVKVHDVFVAAAMEVCRQFVPQQHRRSRPNVAIGSIVDMRPLTSINLSNRLGIFLGFDSVTCTPADLKNWDTLLRAVAKRHQLQKAAGMPPSSLIWMTVAVAIGRFTKGKRLNSFYRKETPLIGGVSNVNLNPTWAARYRPLQLLSFHRVSPTGPMTPAVFTTTTLGNALHICTTFRAGLLDAEQANAITEAFLARLRSL